MVSMDAKFIKLTHDEVLSRISHLIVSQGNVRVWKKDEFSYEGTILNSSEVDSKFILTLKCDQLDEKNFNQELLIHFTVREVNFFGKVKLVEFKMGYFRAELGDDVYKYEKRRSERLLSFPHHKIYAYFAFETELNHHSNVSFLSRANQKQEKLFQRFTEERLLQDSEHGNLTGFRVVDISQTGLSFLTNELERAFFMQNSKDYQLILDFNGVVIKTIRAGVVYDVPYVNPRAKSVSMYKIGMSFHEQHPGISEQMDKLLGCDEIEMDLNDEFEKFLK